MASISRFMYGMILIGLLTGGFVIVMGEMNKNYGTPSTYTEADLTVYNQLNELQNFTEDIKNETEAASSDSGDVDVLGVFFGGGYKALKLSAQSVNIFFTMVNSGITSLGLGSFSDLLRTAIITLVLVVIFFAIIMKALVKTDV